MLARDDERRDALRLILNSLRCAEKELQRPLSEDEELQVLQRERKRRIEAAEAFRAGDRPEQAAKEEAELAILEEFMPEPLDRGGARADRRRRDRRDRRDEHARHGSRDGRRDAADRRPRRRLGGRPARAREARLAPAWSCAASASCCARSPRTDAARLAELGAEPSVARWWPGLTEPNARRDGARRGRRRDARSRSSSTARSPGSCSTTRRTIPSTGTPGSTSSSARRGRAAGWAPTRCGRWRGT